MRPVDDDQFVDSEIPELEGAEIPTAPILPSLRFSTEELSLVGNLVSRANILVSDIPRLVPIIQKLNRAITDGRGLHQ